jgi:hypothetical protein
MAADRRMTPNYCSRLPDRVSGEEMEQAIREICSRVGHGGRRESNGSKSLAPLRRADHYVVPVGYASRLTEMSRALSSERRLTRSPVDAVAAPPDIAAVGIDADADSWAVVVIRVAAVVGVVHGAAPVIVTRAAPIGDALSGWV